MEFLKLLIAFLANYNIVPPEVKDTDLSEAEREKSYTVDLPIAPDNVYVFNNYFTKVGEDKQVGIRYIQLLVRNVSQATAIAQIEKVYQFLLQRPPIDEIVTGKWVMFDCDRGPAQITVDEHGRYIWGLSFPVKTSNF